MAKIARAQIIPNNTEHLFNLSNFDKVIKNGDKIREYVDDEVDGKLDSTYFNNIFQAIDAFNGIECRIKYKSVDTGGESYKAKIRSWKFGGSILEYWIPENNETEPDDYLILFNVGENFLVVANVGCHPHVITPDFAVFNSDGSTGCEFGRDSVTLEDIKVILKKYAVEYVFNQIH
ncbi:Hypothetical protein HVR_LOCUS447 [uncultured virus]|nr:Hypothetical protein HVR_LOCUS447 [uncultured virus]